MLTDRIMGAFTFRRDVYGEVENDPAFTQVAWLIVVVVGFLNQLGAHVSRSPIRWIGGAIVGTLFVVIGFAVACAVINWVGRELFKAQVTNDELVRTLGLAYVWNIIGFIGILAAFSSVLACILAPALIIGGLLGLVAWFVAAKEALDLDWGQTIITVIVGWIILVVILAISGIILGALGLAAGSIVGGV